MAMHLMVNRLIDEVVKYPEIYNPDNKDFSNEEIRNNTFNTIGNTIGGIPGKILKDRWDKMINKYADFIRKLSIDDSSEEVLEQFMAWPWAKPMRNFKPYVRRQFQIPEFEPAIQLLTEINIPNSATRPLHTTSVVGEPSDNKATSSSEFPVSRSAEQGPALQGDDNESPSNKNKTPVTPKPEHSQLVHRVPEPSFDESSTEMDDEMSIPIGDYGYLNPIVLREGTAFPMWQATEEEVRQFSNTMAHGIIKELEDFKKLVNTMGQFPDTDYDDSDDDDDNDDDNDNDGDKDNDDDKDNDVDDTTNDKIATSEVATRDDGPSSAKKRRHEDQSGSDKNVDESDKVCTKVNGNTSHTGDDEYESQTDVLPDLPQPKPVIKKGPLDFTAQEHTFLGWAKTMSTFTAKRQATVKMQINKIMSEAEFEDLDDEFFAAKKEPYRPIYTSRY